MPDLLILDVDFAQDGNYCKMAKMFIDFNFSTKTKHSLSMILNFFSLNTERIGVSADLNPVGLELQSLYSLIDLNSPSKSSIRFGSSGVLNLLGEFDPALLQISNKCLPMGNCSLFCTR